MLRHFTKLYNRQFPQNSSRQNGQAFSSMMRTFSSVTIQNSQQSTDTEAGINLRITDQCLKLVPKSKFLRISVKGGEGCGGFTYEFKTDSVATEEDAIMKVDDKSVLVIDKESLVLLEGSVVDYEETMAREGYVIQTNPNAEQTCSCKMSFNPSDKVFGKF